MGDLLFEKKDGVAVVTFNRPAKKNAFTPEMVVNLADAWTEFRDDETLRVAILTGNGDTFSAGADLGRLIPLLTRARPAEDEWDRRLIADPKLFQAAILRRFELWKPVIAAVNGAALAGRLGIPVVYDFRAADVAAGGHGAPMVPVFHRAMLRLIKRAHPVGVLNLGGVANITFINGGAELVACDTGPGNALIDDFVRLRTGQPQDDEGRAAAAGKVDEAAVARVLKHPFFATPPPKSLDRNAFRHWVTEEGRLASKSTQDGAATLTAITAAAVAHAITVLPRPPVAWIVAGGGTRNPTLMRMLAERLAPAPVETAGAVGWSADALEAQAFAYLAVRTLKGLPLTYPTTTGVPRPLTGGIVARP